MIYAKCTCKLKNSRGRLSGYTLLCSNGKKITITPEMLKSAIRNNKVKVSNMTLSSDNRLLCSKDVILDAYKFPEKFNLLTKIYDTIGNNDKHELRIKKLTIKTVNSPNYGAVLEKKFKAKLKLFGYKFSIKELHPGLFIAVLGDIVEVFTYANKIEFPQDSSEILTSDYLGTYVNISIDILSFYNTDTSNVKNMSKMFSYLEIGELNINCFNTSNVVSMEAMFQKAKIEDVSFRNFSFKHCENTKDMFRSAQIDKIDLSNKRFPRLGMVDSMFYGIKSKELNLDNVVMDKVKHIMFIMGGSIVDHMTLRNAVFYKIEDSFNAFCSTKMKQLDLTGLKIPNLEASGGSFNSAEIDRIVGLNTVIVSDNLRFGFIFRSLTTNYLHVHIKDMPNREFRGSRNTFICMSSLFEDINADRLDLTCDPEVAIIDCSSIFKNSRIGYLNISNTNWDLSYMAESELDIFEYARIDKINITGVTCDKLLDTINKAHIDGEIGQIIR